MIGSNLLDNLDEKTAAPQPVTPPVAPSPELNIPIEDTPDTDVATTPVTTAPNTPVNTPVNVTPEVAPKRPSLGGIIKGTAENALPHDMDVDRIKGIVLNFIVPIISFGVSLLLVLLIIMPSWKSRPILEAEIAQKTSMKQLLSDKKLKLTTLIDLKTVFDENLVVVNKALVPEQLVPELLTEVDHIARSTGLKVDRLSYSLSQNEAGPLGYPQVDIALGVTGTLDQLVNFFTLTENASRLLDISSYRYSVGSSEQNSVSVSLSMNSPFLSVSSEAVIDDPINLDIRDQSYAKFITKIKGLTYYDPLVLTPVEEIVETPEEEPTQGEETTPTEEPPVQ
jgi:Tfp pilus assembly protein PilO